MSLYNELFGINEDTPILLGMLGVNKEYFSRFRDVFLCNKGCNIRVYTRTGGENRKDFKDNWDIIKQNPLYIKDYDEEFDNTYAYIDFNIPEKYKETAKKMYIKEPMTIHELFEKECEEMKVDGSPAFHRALKIADRIMNEIDKNGNGGIIRI